MMKLAVSTHWNAHKHRDGRSMIQEIIEAGFHSVELGYNLTLDLVEGVRNSVSDGSISVTSVHNFCPVPVGAPAGHPELFDLASIDPGMRSSAVRQTIKTIEFAGEMQASAVVLHCGYVDISNMTAKLIDLARNGKIYSDKFEKIKTKLIMKRGKYACRHLDALKRSIEALLPPAEAANVKICPENLPSWEALPSEMEMMELLDEFKSPWLSCWHDTGHGQIRQELGFSSQKVWVDKLKPAGFHIHDMDSQLQDHLMPPRGKIDFSAFKNRATSGSLLVLEPAPETPTQHLIEAAAYLEQCWNTEDE